MEKVDRERNILGLATPLLSELYGNFDIIPDQLDRPDAAINTKTCNIKIGIEIRANALKLLKIQRPPKYHLFF
jgi:hypothetical protein